MTIERWIRSIPDWPKPGILFRDVTTLLQSPEGLATAVEALAARYRSHGIAKVVAIEARGFMIGGAVAHALGAGFVPVRKPGKLPSRTIGRDYTLEYGRDRLEMHADAIVAGESVLVVDDLIATGGTATAAIELVEECGGRIVECAFLIDLVDLGGRQKIERRGHKVFALAGFPGH